MSELERLRELAAINRIITSSLDYDEVLRQVVEKTADFTDAEVCLLLLADPQGQASVVASTGVDVTLSSRFYTTLDERIDTNLRSLLGIQPDRVFTGVPVINQQSLMGILAIYRQCDHAALPDEGFLLASLADQAAIALENAASHRELHEKRQRTEDALSESENRLKLGIQVAGLALAEIDYLTGLNHLSAEATHLYGLGEGALALPRATIHASFHPDDRPALMERIAECLDPAGLGWFAMDHRIVWPEGQIRWLRVRKQVFFAGGAPVRAILAALDVTEEKAAVEELRDSEQRMRLATEATGVGIWEWNVLTNRILWDAKMFRIYGIAPTPDGFVEYSTWSESVLSEDLPLQENVLQDTLHRCGYSTREFRIRRAEDGECRHILAVETVRTMRLSILFDGQFSG